MKKIYSSFIAFSLAATLLSSCTSMNTSQREPNTRLQLSKSDFILSDQVTGEATSTKILGIDFKRLFLKKTGTVVSDNLSGFITAALMPIIGNTLNEPTSTYALYEMMQKNAGYDVILYPQYETKVVRPIGIGWIYKVTTVKATARLGKLK